MKPFPNALIAAAGASPAVATSPSWYGLLQIRKTMKLAGAEHSNLVSPHYPAKDNIDNDRYDQIQLGEAIEFTIPRLWIV